MNIKQMVSALLAVGLSCCLVFADGLTNNQSNITVVRHGSYVYTWIWTNNRVIYMNPSEFWPGTWKEDTNGWRVQLCIYPEANYWYPKEGAGHPISTNLMLSVDWGSVTKSSLDGHYYRPPNGKFAKFELLDAKGNVISSNPNAGSNLLIKLSGGTYGTNLPTWVSPASGSLVAKFQKTISTNVYPQDQYSGMVGEIGAATNMPPFYVGLLKLDEIYSVTNEGDYTLTVQPVLYKRSNTNQAILNRVDLPSVTTKVHLVPNVKQRDVPLTNGMDVITLHATDLAGNVTTLATGLTVDYSGKTNPPAVQLLRPQDGIGDLRQQHRVPGPFEIRMATNGEA